MGLHNTERWVSYWRNSLADAHSGTGIFSSNELEKIEKVDYQVLRNGKLPQSIVNFLFQEEAQDTQVVSISYYPLAFSRSYQHGVLTGANGFPQYILPLMCNLWVHRNGYCLPASAPMISRDLLAPQADDTLALTTVAKLDNFFVQYPFTGYTKDEAVVGLMNTVDEKSHQTQWQPCYDNIELLFGELAKEALNLYLYKAVGSSFLQRADHINSAATRHIVSLYDWLYTNRAHVPLLNTYALHNHTNHQVCIDALHDITQRSGHSNSQFPLTVAQRDALAQTLAMEEGEILAVNGPPGTGKTTFVLSVVASFWVNAAINERDPPLIVAASNNNQAVTNIIDAFGKDFEESTDPVSGRWLPDINSYGGFMASATREAEAVQNYQTVGFYFKKEEPDYVSQAKQYFIEQASEYFGKAISSVDVAKRWLHDALAHSHQQLEQLNNSWQTLQAITQQCTQQLGEDPPAVLAHQQEKAAQASIEYQHAMESVQQWQIYCASESLLLGLFSFLPPVARKRRMQRQLFIEDTFPPELCLLFKQEPNIDLEQAAHALVQTNKNLLERAEQELVFSQELISKQQAAEQDWHSKVQRLAPNLVTRDIASVDAELDKTLRFKLFQLAVHYWEARWLLECEARADELRMQNPIRPKTGMKSVLPRWQRRMMLTPCVVSTLHSLPGHMTYSKFEGNNSYSNHYLINEIDLLIIDEAGQVAPDVAGASFALAKRALVIGDAHQIKPINQLLPAVDCGNLAESGLVSSTDDYNALIERDEGRDVTTGSVMRIAQQASRYRYLEGAEAGMFLREHRRCYDEIIEYCNTLCYKGLLLPKRGNRNSEPYTRLPPMPSLGYLHIDGVAEVSPAGSRINQLEAQTIAQWLSDHCKQLESYYKKALHHIVGVVTPFRAQADLISQECAQLGINVGQDKDGLTVGTVHALQGAERKVIIFSQVYSRHADGQFIDSDPAMLNVAVSRAKDSFLVFGDLDVLSSAARGTPRRLLNDFLESRADAELAYSVAVRSDLVPLCSQPKVLNNAEEHDSYLVELLSHTQKKMDMVSPWVVLKCLESSGLLAAISNAVAKGIEFTLYTDYHFNTTSNNKYDRDKDKLFNVCCETLRDVGIKVMVVQGVHSKLLMMDDTTLCIGSFNWASAARGGQYKNMETSIAYQGQLKKEIDAQRAYLESKCQ